MKEGETAAMQIAVVTGASKGIGAAIARRLATADYHVVVTYFRDADGGKRTVDDIAAAGGTATLAELDVRDEESVNRLFSGVDAAHGQVDLLVNNAAKEVSKPLDQASFDEWRTVLSTKLDGAFLCTRAAAPLFAKAEAPSMIAISTFEGEQPSPDYPAYGVANGGLNAFVKAMALWLPSVGARANAVCPGPVATPLWGPDENNDELWTELASKNPVGRNATPGDVAEVVLMLAKEPTRMINGSFIFVNGGNHLRPA